MVIIWISLSLGLYVSALIESQTDHIFAHLSIQSLDFIIFYTLKGKVLESLTDLNLSCMFC